MSEPRIGRVVVASMHQAIGDVLPNRLEFYENWLSNAGLREGTIGLAQLSAVLSFLRMEEGSAYDRTTRVAGEYAADWTVNAMGRFERWFIMALPRRWRTRRALTVASTLVKSTYPGTRAIVKVRRDVASVDVRGSLFCEVREPSALPLCGFYAAAFSRVLQLLAVPAGVRVEACRASGVRKGCALGVALAAAAADAPQPAP